MKKLQKYSNIIPILAKGDSYTSEEIKAIKLALINQAHDHKIEWFDCLEVSGPRFDQLKPHIGLASQEQPREAQKAERRAFRTISSFPDNILPGKSAD